MNISKKISFKNDNDIIPKTRAEYYEVKRKSMSIRELFIEVDEKEWITSNSLSHILLFIQACKNRNKEINIAVQLVSKSTTEGLLNCSITDESVKERIKAKLIFYDAMEFPDRLNDLGVAIIPNITRYENLKSQLAAVKSKLESNFSSKILSLSPLINNEVEQIELSRRMQTLSNILYWNLPDVPRIDYPENALNKIDIDIIKDFSNKIMYELVKNIYQHADIPHDNDILSGGYACAQIYQFSKMGKHAKDKSIVNSILSYMRNSHAITGHNYLAISINDWGVGIIDKVKNSICNKIDPNIKNETVDDGEILKIAAMSIYSSRLEIPEKIMNKMTSEINYENYYESLINIIEEGSREKWIKDKKDGTHQFVHLEPKGFGLIYCLGFIAITYGTIRIRCNQHEIYIRPSKNAIEIDKGEWKCTWKTAALIQKEGNKYF